MANQSSSASSVLSASFSQDNRFFSIGTRDGFKIFDAASGRLCYERSIGAFSIVEMLFGSSLLALVGAGEQDKTYIYDLNSLAILDTIDTVPNTKGLCAFSPSLDGCYLALPASTTKGSVLVYNVMDRHSHCQIDAHRSPLAAIILSSNGTHLATASEKGTIIRVHLVSQATKSYSFRRGAYPSTIYSLSFGLSAQLPDILTATSSSGSVHIFDLGLVVNQRSQRSNSLLGSMIPDSINDAFEYSYHHVLHNAVRERVKSCAIIHSVEKAPRTSPTSPSDVSRVSIYIITYNGYFREYSLSIKLKESSWSLEREFNLFGEVSDAVFNNQI